MTHATVVLARWRRAGGGRAAEGMPRNLRSRRIPEYRNLLRERSAPLIAKEHAIARELHTLVLKLTARGIPSDHFDWWADLRRGRIRVYGGMLRCFDTMQRQGYPKEEADRILALLGEYVTLRWSTSAQRSA